MARIEKTIFISYRRKDISWALAVYQYLTGQKYDVFFDYTSIPSGDFEQIIVSNIRARAHFVLILTPTALDRCSEPGDWLRREIETAIDEKRNIIPLFFDGFNFGSPNVAEKLTGKLSAIRRYNGLDIPSGYFIEAMERLYNRYLNVPLDAVLHPVSTEVRKLVKKEQIAVSEALADKWEVIKELLKPADEKSGELGQTQIETVTTVSPFSRRVNLRLYGIVASILVVMVAGLAGINAWIQKSAGNTSPTMTNQVVTNTITVDASVTAPVSTATVESQISTPTEETTLTVTPSPTSALGIGSSMTGKDGMMLLYIPAGEFTMGSDVSEDDEKPIHTVYLDAFWIDKTEVTNVMYSKCVQDSVCDTPTSINSVRHEIYFGDSRFYDYPVIYMDWSMAKTYCTWAGRRLPTEAEWEKAARGDDRRIYPWGNTIMGNNLLNYNYLIGDTTKVGEYLNGASPYGGLDMAGNVWEWVSDWYDDTYYANSPPINPLGPEFGTNRVLRGGSWRNPSKNVSSSFRIAYPPNESYNNFGFRCAVSAMP